MKPFCIAVLIPLVVLTFSCADNPVTLDITSRFWPEGATVTVLRDDKPAAVSKLFGDRLSLRLPKTDIYRIRIAHPEYLTSVSPPLPVQSGATAHMLPVPVSRRRIGSTALHIGWSDTSGDSLLTDLINTSPESFSGILLSGDAGTLDAKLVQGAHEKALEVTVRHETVNTEALSALRKHGQKLIRAGVTAGADGIEVSFGEDSGPGGEVLTVVRRLARETHDQGMTFAVGFTPESLDRTDPVSLFEGNAAECPDEIILRCSESNSTPGGESPTMSRIETPLQRMRDSGIPLSRVSVEVKLSATAWEETTGQRRPVELNPGDLSRMIAESGQGGVLRLNDGSCRLVNQGITYAFEDLAGFAANAEFLRTGDFARVRSVRVLFDGKGLAPERAGIQKLAEVFSR